MNNLTTNHGKSNCIVIYKHKLNTDSFQGITIDNAPIEYVDRAVSLGLKINNPDCCKLFDPSLIYAVEFIGSTDANTLCKLTVTFLILRDMCLILREVIT